MLEVVCLASPTLIAGLALFTIGLYVFYQWLLPTPIPGIAYNPEAINSLLGDAPDMIREVNATKELRVWCAKQVKKMNSPICQVFIRPFSKPWILLADFREARDILTRRKEFDKSALISDGMACMGDFHGVFQTGDAFKTNRQLIQDLMTSTFLNNFMGPAIHSKGLELMQLFEIKMKLARARPFSVKTDFEYASLDVMLHFAFGNNWVHTATGPQVEILSHSDALPTQDGDLQEPADFPKAPIDDFLVSVYKAPEVVEELINAIVPKLKLWIWKKQSWYKKIFETKDRVIEQQIAIGIENYRAGRVETGIEHMLMREAARAEKLGREPDFQSNVFVDEIFGDIIGGHHTTSGAMMWLVKYLTDFPRIQSKLRTILRAGLPSAYEQQRFPTFEEIRSARIPYLDAVIEEMLRLNAVTVTREALCDTQILGCHIPKGTQVFLVSNGPGFLSPSLPIDESKRSETSRIAKLRGTWDETEDLTVFDPERWLIYKSDGDGDENVEFDGAAGPQLVFGLGPRGCWGRKLAHMEMRTILALLIWNYELLETPQALSSYAGLEGIARVPQKCYVKLRKI
ncbi:cytochrome P450 [Melanomma pulvis-pyrius CBS 109.77]|uniref:Cytochrome P450 n=1 Tax=Melanomma pulvis-pyrius CBS 109.77 TaxID=1314802 RepID=A0A6A6XUB0_9PLEO|nr:cytochrome P450 [Melanomma pulvis-pyrius CBS 109.77]